MLKFPFLDQDNNRVRSWHKTQNLSANLQSHISFPTSLHSAVDASVQVGCKKPTGNQKCPEADLAAAGGNRSIFFSSARRIDYFFCWGAKLPPLTTNDHRSSCVVINCPTNKFQLATNLDENIVRRAFYWSRSLNNNNNNT